MAKYKLTKDIHKGDILKFVTSKITIFEPIRGIMGTISILDAGTDVISITIKDENLKSTSITIPKYQFDQLVKSIKYEE